MSCKCAKSTDEYHGWECTVSGGACMFLFPNSKKCAEMYGEGPDVYSDSDEEPEVLQEDIIDKIIDEEGDFVSEEDEIDDIIDNEEE